MVSFINHQLPLNPQVHNRPGHKGLFLCPIEKKINLQTTFDLGGGFKHFLFLPLSGEMIQFDGSHIFQRGWFNHQLVMCCQQGRLYGKERETELQRPQRVRFLHEQSGRSTPWSLGMGDLQPLMTGILIMGIFSPLRTWVDEFIPYYMEMSWEFRPDRTHDNH